MTNVAYTIRPLVAGDLASVLDIWLTANIQAHSFIPASYWQNAAPQVAQQLPQAEVYVLMTCGHISGFIGLLSEAPAAKAAYIAGLFVEPASQGQGQGRRLLEHAKQAYPRLTLKVYRQNTGACRFYQRESFRQIDCGIDADTGQEELTMLWP